LEKAYEGREHDLAYSNVWPMFDNLRSDPRFADLPSAASFVLAAGDRTSSMAPA
jgi:hypothetical protein